MKTSRAPMFTLAAVMLIGLAAGAWMIRDRSAPRTSATTVSAPTENSAAYSPTAGKPGTRTIAVRLDGNKIVGSNTITVNKGDAVHITFTGSSDQAEGDITLKSYDLTVPTTRNYTTSMEFKALKAGSFPITLTYEDESREAAEQQDAPIAGTEAELHTATIGSFVVK